MERLYWEQKGTSGEVFSRLNSGHIVLVTTDTVPGFLTMCNDLGRLALNRIKNRVDKPYLILVVSADDAFSLMRFESDAQRRAIEAITRQCWPGPLTVICHAGETVPECAKSSDGTVGLRVPNHPFLQELLQRTGPLFSTSANRSGADAPHTIDAVEEALLEQVALVVVDREGEQNERAVSTIIDCRGAVPRVMRAGACSLKKLRSVALVE